MRRDPFLHWLLVMGTLGQYAFLWGFRLARDVNQLSPAAQIPVRKHARIFAAGYVSYLLAATAISVRLWREGPSAELDAAFWPVYLLGVGVLLYFIWLLARIAKELRRISHTTSPGAPAVILLSFLWMTSLPLLQGHVNKKA